MSYYRTGANCSAENNTSSESNTVLKRIQTDVINKKELAIKIKFKLKINVAPRYCILNFESIQ
jgi:hypothetical protein